MRLESLRTAQVLDQGLIDAAYSEAAELLTWCMGRATVRPPTLHPSLESFAKRQEQEGKVQLQLTLEQLDSLWAANAAALDSTTEKDKRDPSPSPLPPALMQVQGALRSIAFRFLDDLLLRVPSAAPLKHQILKKSVFRMWGYFDESDCRPHYDPGICTVLLGGSEGGLEVNVVDELPLIGHLGNYAMGGASGELDEETRNALLRVSESKHWCTAASLLREQEGDVLVMADTVCQVVTAGLVRHVLHRVRVTEEERQGRRAGRCRVNIVLELRPAKGWYGFQPTEAEKEAIVS